jgi:hypothetical protein
MEVEILRATHLNLPQKQQNWQIVGRHIKGPVGGKQRSMSMATVLKPVDLPTTMRMAPSGPMIPGHLERFVDSCLWTLLLFVDTTLGRG